MTIALVIGLSVLSVCVLAAGAMNAGHLLLISNLLQAQNDHYGVGAPQDPEEVIRGVVDRMVDAKLNTLARPVTSEPRCDFRGRDGDRCERVAGHVGPHEWPTLNATLLGGRST